jgi:acyl carrier protein
VRGYRIELGEVEAALCGHSEVQEAIVVAREESGGEKRLVGYAVSSADAQVTGSELRSYLRERLPEYMVPGTVMVLERLPLTTNGKVDRRALPEPEVESAVGYEGPRTAVEEMVAGIWAEVLRLERVGIHDNFFDLGGHSLLATQILSRLRSNFGVDLPVRGLFAEPTVAGIAMLLVQEQVAQNEQAEMEKLLAELEAISVEDARDLVGREA